MNPDYSGYFSTGQRIRVDISLVGRRSLMEWGTIASLTGNLLTLRVPVAGVAHDAFADGGRQLFVRTGLQGQAYRCRGEVLAFDENMLIISLTGELIPDELREYFRLDTSLSLDYDVYVATPGWNVPEKEPTRASCSEIVNISGGGCKARLASPLQNGDLVRISIGLPHPEPQTVSMVAQVVYCQPESAAPFAQRERYSVGLCYVEINERQRDNIIRYINAEEIRAKRPTPRTEDSRHQAAVWA